jgi:sugar transferase (PEP-CTERM/EpsH1 system associated)
LRFLSARARVHLVCLADDPASSEALQVLRNSSARLTVIPLNPHLRWLRAGLSLVGGGMASAGAFHSPAVADTIRTWAADTNFRAVLLSASSLVPYLELGSLRKVPAIIDLVDVDSQKWLDYADLRRGPRAWVYRTEGRRLRDLERDLPARFAAVTLVSAAEARLYRRFCRPGRVEVVTNGVDLEYFRPQVSPAEASCAFVGAFDYPPNIEGADWFCRDVWPAVRRVRPEARLMLVGRRPTARVRSLASQPGVEILADVPDVRPALARAGVVIAPLLQARGVQNKILEAFAMGKAVVASPPACEGLAAEPDIHLRVAATPADWCGALCELWGNPAIAAQLGAAGRRYVQTHHRWEDCLEPFSALLGLTPAGPGTASSAAEASMTLLAKQTSPVSLE